MLARSVEAAFEGAVALAARIRPGRTGEAHSVPRTGGELRRSGDPAGA
ncbi:hypothetical protein ABZ990_17000 [Streptomyces sp. NPDC046203]